MKECYSFSILSVTSVFSFILWFLNSCIFKRTLHKTVSSVKAEIEGFLSMVISLIPNKDSVRLMGQSSLDVMWRFA